MSRTFSANHLTINYKKVVQKATFFVCIAFYENCVKIPIQTITGNKINLSRKKFLLLYALLRALLRRMQTYRLISQKFPLTDKDYY